MHTLTPEQIKMYFPPTILYILFAFAIFSFSMLSMVVLSGFSIRRVVKYRKIIIILLVISLLVPALITKMYEQASISAKAEQRIEVQYLRTQKLDGTTTLVSFSTSIPALVYAEYTDNGTNDTYPIFQENKTDNKVLHTFVIRNIKLERGSVIFIINGIRYLYQGKPLEV